MEHFSPTLEHFPATAEVKAIHAPSLDAYALGYCIANFPLGVSWAVGIFGVGHHSFTCGLNTNTPCVGNIKELKIFDCPLNFADLKSNPLSATISLSLQSCQLTNTDMLRDLSELIPHLPHLQTLDISLNHVTDGEQDGLLKILHQLCDSKVTGLGIVNTGLGKLLDSPHDYSSTIKRLIHPSSGTLHLLGVGHIGDFEDNNDDKLAALVLAPSSLKQLILGVVSLSPYAVHLKNNTCLTALNLVCADLSAVVSDVVDIVTNNKTLQELWMSKFSNSDIDAVRPLVRAICENTTLQHIELYFADIGESDEAVFAYMKTHHKDLTYDSRIAWKVDFLFL